MAWKVFVFVLVMVLGTIGTSYAQTGPGGVEQTNGSSNLKLWLEADEGVTTSSGNISSWADQSGYGNTADQSSSSARPKFESSVVNGKPVARFDGTDDVLTGSSVLAGGQTGRTIFLVSNPNSTGDIKQIALNYSNTGSGKGKNYTPTPEIKVRTGGSFQEFGSSQSTSSFSVLTFRNASGGIVKNIEGFLNGSSLNQTNNKAGGTTLDIKGSDYALGNLKGFPSIDLFFDGDIAEAIVFDKELNEAERIAAENYLASKYGLSSSLNRDKFAHDSGYGDDVAGIGQAYDGSTQSTAYSSLLRVTNPGSTSNSEFLFYGHDGASAGSWTNTESPSTDFQRIEREWKFDETGGDVGKVTLEVDTTKLPSLPSGYTTYYAILSNDNDFSTRGDQSLVELTSVSGTVRSATVNVQDDRHLTYVIGTPAATPQNVSAASDLNERIEVTFDEVTTNKAGLSTTLTGDQYIVYIDSKDNSGFSVSDATQLTKSTDYTISTSSGTVTANVTQDQSEDNGTGTTKIDNGTDYALWVAAKNEVDESAKSSQVTATPNLKVFFKSATSTGSEKNNANTFKIKLSDTNSQDVSVDLAIAPDGQSPFDGTSLRSVKSVSIDNGGSGYSDGDIIGEDDSGDGGSGLQIEVTSVDGNGTVQTVDLEVGGSGYTSFPTSFTALSGSGTGATFTGTLQSSASDYNLKTTSPTISAGNTTTKLKSEDLVFNDDTDPENTETVELTLSNPTTSNTTATLGSQTAHDVDINDNDLDRKVYLTDNIGTADDGNTSEKENTSLSYTLTLNNSDPVNDTKVDYQIDTGAGTAEDSDFSSVSGTVTIKAGNSSKSFTLPVSGDSEYEDDETADVNLTGAENANLDNSQSGRFTTLTHTVTNDDSAPVVSFKNTSLSDEEADSTVNVTVQLDTKSSEDITVDLSKSGTATGGGTDYTFSASSVTIPAGNTSATLSPSFVEDALDENDETLKTTLSSVSSGTATIGSDDTNTYTITDDDPKPTVSFSSTASSAKEDAAGTQNIEVTLSEASGRQVTVDYSKAGTAVEDTDYSDSDNGSISISAGNTSKNITLSITADDQGESNETVDLSFSSSSITNGDAGSTSAFTFTITNDDLGFTGPAGVGSQSTNPLWVRADSGITKDANDNVSAWDDLSGNANDATAPSGSAEPSFVSGDINGEPSLSFDGTDDVLTGSSVLAGGKTGRTAIVVYNPNNRADEKLLALNYSNVKNGLSNGFIYSVTPELGVRVGGGASEIYQKPDKSYHITTFRNGRGEKVSSAEAFLDGTESSQKSVSDGTIDVQGSDYAIGDLNPSGFDTFYSGEIAEIIVYSNELNEAQRTIVENYLDTRYGFGADYAGTDIYTDSPGSFTLELFGVGKESDGSHQASANAGLRFDINSGFDNGDYVMAGHNTSSNSVNTSDVPGCCQARMERIWKLNVTNSGTNATVDLTFDLSDAGLNGPAGTATDYKLIKGGSNSWSKIADGSTVSGDKITFSNVDVTNRGDGEYTIATADQSNSPLNNNQPSLIIEGTSGTNEADEGWRFMGLPVNDGSAGDLQKADGSQFINYSYNMAYTWDDTNQSFSAITSDVTLPEGEGFILWIFDQANAYPVDTKITIQLPTSRTFTGNTNVSKTGLKTGTGNKHLLSNPYRDAYNLNSLGNTGSDGFKDQVQIWEPDATINGNDPSGADDGNKGSYVTRSRSQGEKIAGWQGFWLFNKDSQNDSDVTFNSSGISAGASPGFVGSKSRSGSDQVRQINLQVVGRDSDSTMVAIDKAASLAFAPGATLGVDYLDSPKLTPYESEYAVIGPVGTGSGDSTTIKAQESRPVPEEKTEIPLAFQSEGASGEFTITAPEWENVPDDWELSLVDTKGTDDPSDDTTHVLGRDGAGYTFSYSATKQKNAKTTESEKEGAPVPGVEKLDWTPRRHGVEVEGVRQPGTKNSVNRKGEAAGTSATAKQAASTRFKLRVAPNSEPLPVEMADFAIRTADRHAVLNWTTASETNNAGFYVEHQRLSASDSTADPGEWSELGYVEGAGTTTSTQDYRYRTERLEIGRHAFRLRQIDTDGGAQYTEARRVEVRLDQPYTVSSPYPNPVQGQATVEVAVQKKQQVRVVIFDVLGRQVGTTFRGQIAPQHTKSLSISTQRLASGVYFVRVTGDQFSVTKKMTVTE